MRAGLGCSLDFGVVGGRVHLAPGRDWLVLVPCWQLSLEVSWIAVDASDGMKDDTPHPTNWAGKEVKRGRGTRVVCRIYVRVLAIQLFILPESQL